MQIPNINQIYQEKLQEIQSKVPSQTSVSNKFQSLLEDAQIAAKPVSDDTNTSESISTDSTLSSTDTNKLLTALLTQQSSSATSSLLTGQSSNSNSLFPTSSMNSAFSSLQQTALIKSLMKNNENE